MISVLNHLLPLNGNKQVTFLLVPIFVVLFSCRTTAPIVKPDVVEPIVIKDIVEPIKDTAIIPIIDVISDTSNTENPQIKKKYKIGVLLPFTLDNYNYSTFDVQSVDFSRATQMSIEFYQGFNMAIEEINNGKISAEIHVFDTKNNPEEVRQIFKRSPFPDVDIVVGPVYNKNLRIASNYCRSNEIPMISPLSSSTSITTNNEFYYSANGTSESHYETLLNYIHEKFPEDTLRIIHNNTEAELKVIKKLEAINQLSFKDDPIIFNNIFLSTETIDIEEFKEDFDSLRNHVVLVPSTKEIYTSFALSKLAQIHNDFPSVVFGMPTWRNFKNINYDYLEWLQVHLTSPYWANEHQFEVANFNRDFVFKYSMEPSEYAYQGYDLANFIANYLVKDINYKKEKDRFFSIDKNNSGLQTKFEFIPRSLNGSENIDYWDNQYIQMLKFENYRFNKVD